MARCWGTLRNEGYLIRMTLIMTYCAAFCLRFSHVVQCADRRERMGSESLPGSLEGKFDHKPGIRQSLCQ